MADEVALPWYVTPTKERARTARKNRRYAQRVADEDAALQLFVEGLTVAQIAASLRHSREHAYDLVERALTRRAEEVAPEVVDNARVLYTEGLRRLYESWMPRALGSEARVDPNTGPQDAVPPSDRAAEMVLKILDRLAAVNGVQGPPKRVEMDVTVHTPADIHSARDEILASLNTIRDKSTVIDGHLAAAGAQLRDNDQLAIDDRPAPPPTGDT